MDGNNVNNNIPNVNNQNVPPNNQNNNHAPEYRLVIDEKPYRRRSIVPMLVMALIFVGIVYGLYSLVNVFIGPEETFDPNNVETRKFEDILQDKNVSFYISGKIYTTRLSPDVEIVQIDNNVGYTLVRDSLYYKYYFQGKAGDLNFDSDNYAINNEKQSVNYLNTEEGLVVSIENLEQGEMDTSSMKKMCIDFVNNTKESNSDTPMSEYLKHSIIYGYQAKLSNVKKVRYIKNLDNNTKKFEFESRDYNLILVSSSKDTSEMEVKEFEDGVKIYDKDSKYYIYLSDHLFEISLDKINKEENEEFTYTIDDLHENFVNSLKKA